VASGRGEELIIPAGLLGQLLEVPVLFLAFP
jgi:hypothetical protein